ncbi:MAG TPA: universal stress protein, partial [Salinimicrobium sp.]|nr:universal stress protein [Salinimicrobium sp.]
IFKTVSKPNPYLHNMKKILVPTDFSKEAENALKLAAQLARKADGEIFLLHMLELPMQLVDPVMANRSNDLPEALFFMKLAKKRFSEILSQPFLQGIKVHEKVHFHQAFEGIIEASRECDCELIVMGSKGANGFKEMFIGSNTEKVVRTSEIPVLVIKNDHREFKVKDFVFATDFDLKNKSVLEQVVKVTRFFGAKLHLVYINTANNFLSSKEADLHMEEYMEGCELEDYALNVYNDSSVETGILNYAKKIDAELIGIATHGRKGLSHFFNGSVSEDLVNHANMPVVTFHL